jgi:hypothetical protein
MREMEAIKRQLVIQAIKLHILSHNLSDKNNPIIQTSEVEIDWSDRSVSFYAEHSGTKCRKTYDFYELDLEGITND